MGLIGWAGRLRVTGVMASALLAALTVGRSPALTEGGAGGATGSGAGMSATPAPEL